MEADWLEVVTLFMALFSLYLSLSLPLSVCLSLSLFNLGLHSNANFLPFMVTAKAKKILIMILYSLCTLTVESGYDEKLRIFRERGQNGQCIRKMKGRFY